MQPSFTRRDILRMSIASSLGLSFSGWLPSLAAAAANSERPPKACILLWMAGGPSQTDTFDLKPNHENGGPFKEIATTVPGIKISEHLPGIAKQMKDLCLIRGMTSKEGEHTRASELMMTGYLPGQAAVKYPSLGSIVAKELGREDNELPNFVSVSPFRFGNVGGPGFLGPQYAPLNVSGNSDDPQARANMTVENLIPVGGLDKKKLGTRVDILNFIQDEFNRQVQSEAAKAHRANYDRAVRMVESQAKNAFKLEEEKDELRDAYGRNRFGQGCLLARRLVERGVPFVEVTLSNAATGVFGWDTHLNNFDQVEQLSGILDPAWATLMNDLRDRGLLDSTLICWMGEFGRTPNINGNQGRDHFPLAWSTVLGGGGVKGGQVFGDTGKDGMEIAKEPMTVPNYYATICELMGIDPGAENISSEGRPIRIVEEGGEPVEEIVA